MTTPDAASRCADLTHCITCSDALELVRLDTISDDHAVGICADVKGNRSEILLELVPDASVGSWLLAHAGVAMLISEPPHIGEVASA